MAQSSSHKLAISTTQQETGRCRVATFTPAAIWPTKFKSSRIVI